MKAQPVRMVDVVALGPFMMWAATQRTLPSWARSLLFASGVLTVVYNAGNYLKVASGE